MHWSSQCHFVVVLKQRPWEAGSLCRCVLGCDAVGSGGNIDLSEERFAPNFRGSSPWRWCQEIFLVLQRLYLFTKLHSVIIQDIIGWSKISVHLMITIQSSGAKRFLITLYYCMVAYHRSFLPGSSLEPTVISTAQVSSFRLHYFQTALLSDCTTFRILVMFKV